jgi:hypothetical protein
MTLESDLANLKKDFEYLDSISTAFESVFEESILNDRLYALTERQLSLLKRIHKDTDEWIDWFVFEQQFGNNDLKASINGKEYDNKSIEEFCAFYVEVYS